MRKRERFVVGFDRDGQSLYGPDEDGHAMYIDAMPLAEARARIKRWPECGCPVAIYRLERVEVHQIKQGD